MYHNNINYFLTKMLLRELYFTGVVETTDYCSSRKAEKVG